MNRSFDKLPKVMAVSQCDRFNHLIDVSTTQAGGSFCSVNRLSEWTEQADSQQSLCVVIDYSSPEVFDASNVIVRLREVMALLVVVDSDDSEAALHAASMGALKLIPRPIDSNELLRDFHRLFEVCHSGQGTKDATRSVLVNQYGKLTEREKSILRLLMRGEPNKRIAAQLDIGLRTVESDRANLMRVFGVGSFAELIQRATIAAEQMRIIRAHALGQTLDSDS